MRRAIVGAIVRRGSKTLVYVASVFAVVGTLGYVEWRWETESWASRLTAGTPRARAEAFAQYGLRVGWMPRPMQCDLLAGGLTDVPEVSREALPAAIHIIRSGRCIGTMATLLASDGAAHARVAAARALTFTPVRRRMEAVRALEAVAGHADSVGAAALEALRQLGVGLP